MSGASPDARLSNYRLERLLGSGGMGSVYLAHDLTLDRRVAIKFINADRALDPAARHRLLREARAAAALDHPNICAVHQVLEEPDGRTCIVMQYVEGETLAERLRRGPLEARLALSLACDLAEALSAAHRHGIVHRDLKPQNVMVTPDRRARLLDFGIARLTPPPESASGASTHTSLTTAGVLVGTLQYMSPEQAQQLPIDGRSDLFALGAVLYECLTGRRAFEGRTPGELFGQVLNHQPPAVSEVRPELTDRYDEICRRLLAKHPDDRFRSAEELLGALRVVSPDTGRSTPSGTPYDTPRPAGWRGKGALVAAAVLIVVAAAGVWRWNAAAPPDPGDEWYRRGTEFIRDGSYHSARLALEKAIEETQGQPDARVAEAQAYLRLAEAHSELDETDSAQRALINVARLVTDRSALPMDDRLRVDALQALLTRDLAGAVAAYRELASRRRNDAGVWVDLGRAQEASALGAAARESYEQAIQIDASYAAARLRRAIVLAAQNARVEALKEFDEAEQLYRAASNVEGEIETLLRRGTFLNGLGNLKEARVALQRAADLASSLRSRSQEIRAQIQLSSVTALEGNFAEAETLAAAGVQAALEEGFETVAAEGLIDLANVMVQVNRLPEAEAHLARAISLAERRDASRILTRARLQQASVMLDRGRRQEAIDAATATLDFSAKNSYRRYELKARSIIARGLEGIGRYAEAKAMAEQVLAGARDVQDYAQMSEALESLAGQATAVGAFPEALAYRSESEQINRRQNELAILAYDLTNRADLLMRLGRSTEAIRLLDEVDEGSMKGLDAFKQRGRRVQVLRALDATIHRRFEEAARLAAPLLQAPEATSDSPGRLAERLLQHAEAQLRQRGRTVPPAAYSPTHSGRELFYWDTAARLASGDARAALKRAAEALASDKAAVPDEFEWRIAALGAAAARRLDDPASERRMTARAEQALGRLRTAWKQHAPAYEARPDLVDLRSKAGLTPRS